MRGVNGAPTLRNVELIQKEFNRPPAAPGQAFLHFLNLLGHVDMNPRIITDGVKHGFEKVWRHGAQAVG